ncbi:hypothetical protein QBC38DRAFT_474464 [Podospora fimiseda]|uniref:Coiled-coil domain-containing protein 16 n=1 Tax=Podospora fimiseda TaxID=252190 RepID=A0AAN7BS33_9PEZI|nr:hypothetical protein QBC38DRAFT_474464 [Podospora fimiseda]
MADVRALLRQQRAARRIEHPLAAYSDSGKKLTCTACREVIKSEALWEGHLRSGGHRQRVQLLQGKEGDPAPAPATRYAGFIGDQQQDGYFPAAGSAGGSGSGSITALTTTATNKRKHEEEDEDMGENENERKRTKQESGGAKPLTPPPPSAMTRRTSGTTPTFGVEMQIPSRPATPGPSVAREREDRNNSTGTLMPISSSSNTPRPVAVTNNNRSTMTTAITFGATAAAVPAPVDDDVWAEFEADLVQEKPKLPAAVAALDSDAVISAPVMSAAEVAAKSEEEERQKRRLLADIQLEDEKEDATRALETEFEVMEELEARAKKLRERREALRLRGGSVEASTPVAAPDIVGVGRSAQQVKGPDLGKENTPADEMDEDDDEDDDEEDDWDGFRFRA